MCCFTSLGHALQGVADGVHHAANMPLILHAFRGPMHLRVDQGLQCQRVLLRRGWGNLAQVSGQSTRIRDAESPGIF